MQVHLSSRLLAALLFTALGCPGEPKDDDPVWTDDSAEPAPDTGCEDPRTWYEDGDGDGFGAEAVEACTQPEDAVRKDGDCDDEDNSVYPSATDVCDDGLDADCDGGDDACPEAGSLANAAVKVHATGQSDDAGRHMDAGDLDGDGATDVVVGEMWADGYRGGAYLLYGPVPTSGSFDDLAVEVSGGAGSYEGGRTVGIDDVDGDGLDDLLLGAPDASGYDAVVFFGPVADGQDFSDADVRTSCSADVECGHGGDLADIDGDGVADAIIGAGEERNGGDQTGSVYLLFGPLESEDLDLRADHDAELAGTVAGTETGRVVVAGGDIDGDGIGDVLITSGDDSAGGPSAGAVYVVLSPIVESRSLDDAEAKLLGASAYGYAGEAIAMGDVGGDGLSDAIVGAFGTNSGDGAAQILFGPLDGTLSLGDAECTLRGDSGESFGIAVSARDLDGDEADELLVGAGENSETGRGAGAAYLFAGPLSGSYEATDAALTLTGEARRDGAGYGVGFADLREAGEIDLLVGAPGESTGDASAGALYLVRP